MAFAFQGQNEYSNCRFERGKMATEIRTPPATAEEFRALLLEHGYARPGDRVVFTAGVPFDTPGSTNQLKVEIV